MHPVRRIAVTAALAATLATATVHAAEPGAPMAMYAPDSVAECNNRATFATPAERKAAYDALFKEAKFYPVLESGKEVVDLNREVFVLRRIDGDWKIVLYSFNTDPVQGEG